jgi:hypothetical protein
MELPSDVESDDDGQAKSDSDMPGLLDVEDDLPPMPEESDSDMPGLLEVEDDLPPDVDESDDDGQAMPKDSGQQDVPPPPEPTHTRSSSGKLLCGCKMGCHSKFERKHIEALRSQHKGMADADRKKFYFQLVKAQVCDKDGHPMLGNMKWALEGVRVCRNFFEYAHGLGHGTVDKLLKLIREGALEPPEAALRMPGFRSGTQSQKADFWFFDLWQSLAEPLAEADDDMMECDDDEGGLQQLEDESHLLWALTVNLPGQELGKLLLGNDKGCCSQSCLCQGDLDFSE